MSRERDLLVRTKVLLECSNMEPLQDQADLIVKEIQELLAQPEQEPSTDDYMYNKLKEDYEYLLNQMAPTREPLSDEAVCEILIKKEWRGFIDLVRIIEKEHGIES